VRRGRKAERWWEGRGSIDIFKNSTFLAAHSTLAALARISAAIRQVLALFGGITSENFTAG
jgi:hypothetical protein